MSTVVETHGDNLGGFDRSQDADLRSLREDESFQALLKRLKDSKYRAKIVSSTTGGKTLYQVQVGPITGAKAAEEAARNLKAQEKITPKVVKMANKKNQKTPKKTGAPLSRGPAR